MTKPLFTLLWYTLWSKVSIVSAGCIEINFHYCKGDILTLVTVAMLVITNN